MTLTAPVVVGSVEISANTFPVFGDLDRAIQYILGSTNGTEFIEAPGLEQKRALITAKRWLDRQNWKAGFPVPTDGLVPLGIEMAQYELAILLVENGEAFTERSTGSNERVLQAGSARIEFFSRTDGGAGEGEFPVQVSSLLTPYLAGKGTIITPAVGGTGNQSKALGVDQLGITEPY